MEKLATAFQGLWSEEEERATFDKDWLYSALVDSDEASTPCRRVGLR